MAKLTVAQKRKREEKIAALALLVVGMAISLYVLDMASNLQFLHVGHLNAHPSAPTYPTQY